jgi:hypothetical protein
MNVIRHDGIAFVLKDVVNHAEHVLIGVQHNHHR